ncbi:translation repressor/antiviral protein Ski3, putative [Talaromyces stipitatus ATCC 10500]|uniref:Translation repressor/antiviral protein Ski3, putative n=1 Tax=Talaromyces stipitatus (strain ATCC 10500 / CBS 375.48 / QM 6759 / NRRL 1006) TaxID=441959 RepID=B8MTI7_TALSN|nr:translation repressor/antiviral protein Ski3, putative [Talaromyces stipitatus ATCC 10500]EED12393.1 translation repressor/antiviral protein Ski3, putative [Talaromyces stipitatus ATCC 10500]
MSAKAALKAVKSALDSKDFELAASKAKDLVDQDSTNYHAHIFLGLAQDKLGKPDAAESSYLAASRIKENDKTAWQGLITLYEKQGSKKVDAYRDVVLKLGHILAENGERDRCVDVVDKFIKFNRQHGNRTQQKQALHIQLPTCPLYPALEGRVPHPADTYSRLIELTEAEEKEFINREIGERRTRLGAKIDQVTTEVKCEALSNPELEQYYRGLIDWTNDDGIRHQTEERLLQRAYDFLLVLPHDQKFGKLDEVIHLARDMVIIKHTFLLAWKIELEWKDVEDFSEWDPVLLRDFAEFFPEDGLSKVIQGFLKGELSPFPTETELRESAEAESNDVKAEIAELAVEDRLILMSNGLEQSADSIIAHRVMAQLYLNLEEFASAVEVARKGISILKDVTRKTGLSLQQTTDYVNITLATALISYQSPRNHPEAKSIFESILKRKPKNTKCLLGIGLILEEDHDYEEAYNFLQRARERDPSNIKIRSELAWCTALNGNLQDGLEMLQDVLSEIKNDESQTGEFRAEILYRIGHCQWEIDPSSAARKNRNGAYASFLASIQADLNYAPAYTMLGIYYSDYKKDKARAKRCFHKAFELSSSEIEAAERLAKAFANKQEWNLVEAVAQRVVDSGKAKPAPGSKRKGHSWPYAALGVVQLNKQQYTKSIVSYQAALRISPGDYHSWVGLGESYHNSGRYIAATKAYEHAEASESTLSKSDGDNVWFSKYMLANVKRELGEYEDAISRYEDVLAIRSNEFGVMIALLQTLTESSYKNLETGLFNDAAKSARRALKIATAMAKETPNVFNMWRAAGDACAVFSYVKAKSWHVSASLLKSLLTIDAPNDAYDILADTDDVGSKHALFSDSEEGLPPLSDLCIYASILAYKRAVYVSANDVHGQAVSWYNLGWAEYRAYRCIEGETIAKKDKRFTKKFLKAAIRCFKQAIELEAGNSEFWNSLGVVTASLSPKVAQHAFVRSLHLNDRSAQNWTNIGVFYLIHNDLQLANEAFTRGQSADPDYAPAWLGQGIVALLFGDPSEARALFRHAFDISTSSSTLTKKQYTLSLFDRLLEDASISNELSQLIQPYFALQQLHFQEPSSLSFEHLSALFAERIGEYGQAESALGIVCTGVEAEYEVSESSSSLIRFALANADIARVHLANHEYEQAVEKAELALTLSGDDNLSTPDPGMVTSLRLSSHLTAGLAYYYLKSMDQAIDMFRDALHEAENDPDVVCLLAQVLWAKGGEEERNVAREQLFDCVEKNPDHNGAVTLLGAIALLDGDEDAIEAVHADLETMRTRDDIEIHDRTRVVKLLSAISAMGLSGDSDMPEAERKVVEANRAVMLAPGLPQGWMELTAATGEVHPATIAVKTALRNVPPNGGLDAVDLCKAYVQTGTIGDSLRAIMVAPWKMDGWDGLSENFSDIA